MLAAYVETGSIKAAAEQLGIKEQAGRHRLHELYRRVGIENAVQAAFLLGKSEQLLEMAHPVYSE